MKQQESPSQDSTSEVEPTLKRAKTMRVPNRKPSQSAKSGRSLNVIDSSSVGSTPTVDDDNLSMMMAGNNNNNFPSAASTTFSANQVLELMKSQTPIADKFSANVSSSDMSDEHIDVLQKMIEVSQEQKAVGSAFVPSKIEPLRPIKSSHQNKPNEKNEKNETMVKQEGDKSFSDSSDSMDRDGGGIRDSKMSQNSSIYDNTDESNDDLAEKRSTLWGNGRAKFVILILGLIFVASVSVNIYAGM